MGKTHGNHDSYNNNASTIHFHAYILSQLYYMISYEW